MVPRSGLDGGSGWPVDRLNDPLLTAVDVPETPEGGAIHPEMRAEQEYIEKAHAHLDAAREKALRLTSMVEVGQGGTNQARFEREAIYDQVLQRLKDLQVGDASLVFGRIDQAADAGGDRLYIGRIGVWDDRQDPVVVDWRAPASEPSSTGRPGSSPSVSNAAATSLRGAAPSSVSRTRCSAT